jgi:predicted GNAT family N-acyltransferase
LSSAVQVRVMSWSEAAVEARRIRVQVFVAEQGVPIELELDEWDARCDHALAHNAAGATVGTGRLLPDGRIGRMAVLAEARKRGVGAALLEALIAQAIARGMDEVVLHAQTHAAGFYSRFGFREYGDEFMEAGIPHIAMKRRLP